MARSPRCNATHWALTMPWSASRSGSKTWRICVSICARRSTRFERRTDPVVVMQAPIKRRGLADTIGFAHLDRQMDALMQRIDREDTLSKDLIVLEMVVSVDINKRE